MKRFCLAVLVIFATAVPLFAADHMFFNNGDTTITVPPQVDATNFVNEGRFIISTSQPYQFSSVLNYTNRGLMRNGYLDGVFVTGGIFSSFTSGFWFDTAPPTDMSWNRRPAANFYNAPLAGNVATNATIYGDYELRIQATNIVNSGALRVSEYGVVNLAGRSVDLSRGLIQTAGFSARTPTLPEGIFDSYWYFGTNTINPDLQFNLDFPFTTLYDVIFFPPPYFTNQIALSLFTLGTNSLVAKEFITQAGTNRTVQIVFVRTSNPNITAQVVSSGNTATRLGIPVIEWSSVHTNPAGVIQTNFLYLQDRFGFSPTNRYITNYPYAPPPPSQVGAVPPLSFQPVNYTVSRTAPLNFAFANPGVDFTDKPSAFWGIDGPPVTVTGAVYSAYGTAINSTPTTSADPATIRGGPGRILIQADRTLNATLTRVDALSYLKLNATNHFVGASNAVIAAPYSDIALSSTNGYLNVSSILQPVVHRISGTLDCYSVLWTNTVFFNGNTNAVTFNVLMVDAFLEDTTPAQIFDAKLKATTIEVGDTLNVLTSLSITADHLNVTSNGVITIGNNGISWNTSVPRLKTLTNSGTISGINTMDFIYRNLNGTTKPMDEIVNFGLIQAAGVTMTAQNIYNWGGIESVNGMLRLSADEDIDLGAGGFLSAPEANINIDSLNLYVTNHSIVAGRKLTLDVPGQLFAVTNEWLVHDGIALPELPQESNLDTVVLRSKGAPFQLVTHIWSGSDLGPQGAGYINNAALGMLVLDGDVNTTFKFSGSSGFENALYVDRLELTNSAGLLDASGNLRELEIDPDMVIYYAQATINGASVAEFLDGKNDGRLRWVSSHAGPFSGVNVVYPDGSTNFLNAALVASCNLDSDNDGIPNCADPTPVLLMQQARLTAQVINNPNPALSLSWLTVGWATNRVYTSTNLKAESWQFYTNLISPAQPGPPFKMQFVVPLSGSRFYRVDVATPPQ